MRWKHSQFNLIDEVENEIYSLYNTKTRNHLILDFKKSSRSKLLLNGDKDIEFLPENVLEKLIKKGFVVSADMDEVEELRDKSHQDKFKTDFGLILAILPTLACNFKCSYCFEDPKLTNSYGVMNRATQDNIVRFTISKLKEGIKGPVYIKWFGGEPLLAYDIMISLSEKLKNAVSAFGNKYMSAITTNGYFLNKLSKDKINALSVFAIQVTIDGPEHIHNKRRPHKYGNNSFLRIIKNLKYISEFFENVYVRINVDKTNAENVSELLQYLKENGLMNRFKYYIGYVETESGRYSLDKNCSSLLKKEDVNHIYSTISNSLSDKNLDIDIWGRKYPRVLSLACDAQIKNSYVIAPNGYVFKCLNDATIKDRSLFNINDGEKLNAEREKMFLEVSPFSNSECKNCQFLPICQGGCPAKQIDLRSKGNNSSLCWPFCYTLREKIVTLAKNIIDKQKKCIQSK